MLTKLRNRLAQEEGFTLIELLVVILIIGILAAVAIPTFLSQKNKANDSNAQSNLKNAQTVVEAFASGNEGNYPLITGSTPTALNQAGSLSTDSDATALGTGANVVYYSTPDTSNSDQADSYTLCSEGSTNSTPHFWYITVANGTTYYGEVNGTAGQDCTTATAPQTSAMSTQQFPAITTS